MTERTATPASSATEAFGIADEAQLPAASRHAPPQRAAEHQARTWLRSGTRVIRNAALAVAIMALVPLVTVTMNGDKVWRLLSNDRGVRLRAEISEATRPLVLPKDPSITPMQAALAFNALLPSRDGQPGFSPREPASRPARSWEGLVLEPGLFPTAPQWGIHAGPGSNRILEAATKGFTPAEAEYLRTVATAPAWREFDIVARAPAVDLLGGLYTSLDGVTRWEGLPTPPYKTLRTMANAGISRAAWHLSRGERDSAETALRAVVSFGFALVDNGTTPADQLIGNVIIATGRNGMRHFYQVTGDARAISAAVAIPRQDAATLDEARATHTGAPDVIRRNMIARLANPAIPRSERIQAMRMLALSQCTNVREMLMGPHSDVSKAITTARVDLTRFPSDRPVIDLASRPWNPDLRATYSDPVQMLKVSAAAVVGGVIGNPQMATCTFVATSRYIP